MRLDDFRINPEHPPLVKLWVGSFISPTGFQSSALRPFSDKQDERTFAEEDVYLHNDPVAVQQRARAAMWALNGVLLVALGFAARRAFGSGVALGTIAFLAIDPTVAAHLPVAMTDLPVSLLCASAVLLTIPAFRAWKLADLAACSVALGLALAAKHSGPVFLIFVFLAGCVKALLTPPPDVLLIMETSPLGPKSLATASTQSAASRGPPGITADLVTGSDGRRPTVKRD